MSGSMSHDSGKNLEQGKRSPLEFSPAQAELLEHLRTLPTTLAPILVEGAKGFIGLNGGDFSLSTKPAKDMFYHNVHLPGGFNSDTVIFLSTPDVRFCYDPKTGVELANTMDRYGVSDRGSFPERWAVQLRGDSALLRGKNLEGLAGSQDKFIDLIAPKK